MKCKKCQYQHRTGMDSSLKQKHTDVYVSKQCQALLICIVSLCSSGWPGTQRSACFSLPSARIKNMRHHN